VDRFPVRVPTAGAIVVTGSPETLQPHPSPGVARAIQLGADFVAVLIAAFVGVPLLVITFTMTIIGILYFSVLGFAAAGIALLTLPALGLVIIPALIAHIVESRASESPHPPRQGTMRPVSTSRQRA